MNPIIIFVLVLAFIITIAAIIISARQKRIKEVWQGKVIDKQAIETTNKRDGYDMKQTLYYLKIELTDGAAKRVKVSQNLYDTLTAGDLVEKVVGSYDPVKR